jgi:hypothetical protein
LYLGVHWPFDVLGSLALALILLPPPLFLLHYAQQIRRLDGRVQTRRRRRAWSRRLSPQFAMNLTPGAVDASLRCRPTAGLRVRQARRTVTGHSPPAPHPCLAHDLLRRDGLQVRVGCHGKFRYWRGKFPASASPDPSH